MAMSLKRGYRFTHRTQLALDWTPGAGQKWATDAPKMACEVTRVSQTTVWFREVGKPGSLFLDRATFEDRYL